MTKSIQAENPTEDGFELAKFPAPQVRKVGRPRTKPRPEDLDLALFTKQGLPRKIAPSKRPKRQPVHTTQGKLNAMKNALLNVKNPIKPPPHASLREGDEPFWDTIISTRARDEWTPNDLVMAVQLARCQADIETEQEALDQEGTIVETTFGPKTNPRTMVVERLCKREVLLSRILQMHALGLGKRADKMVPGRKIEASAREVVNELEDGAENDDDLLASVDGD